jgi:predicted TPR repeat methyltransferase
MPRRDFLKDVYELTSVEAIRAFYDDWSVSYDDEIAANGYATPARIAAALAEHMTDRELPILDFGCGTGLSGLALRAAGFTAIDGCDLSPAMLAKARDRGIYRNLWLADGTLPGRYAAIAAAGVVSRGAAPPDALDLLAGALTPGGLLAFSFNDHTVGDPGYEAAVAGLLRDSCRQILRQDGAHLPGIGLGATVIVLSRR